MKKHNFIKVISIITIFVLVFSIFSVKVNADNKYNEGGLDLDLYDFDKELRINVLNDTPKYIFIVIGDGMGAGHLESGKLFNKIISGDMGEKSAWETFPTQLFVKGGADSSQGGTMIATGNTVASGLISMDQEGKPLRTILDIAKDNGLSTGVITTASLIDATPATFLSHSEERSMKNTIANGFPESNVDFIAGGGLDALYIDDDLPEEYEVDCVGNSVSSDSTTRNVANMMGVKGYSSLFGLSGAKSIIAQNIIDNDKVFGSFTRGNLPFYFVQHTPKYAASMKETPSLIDITNFGIESLYKNPNGFCVMIEASAIDDAVHNNQPSYIAAEMGVLDRTLDTILDFYYLHPEETLIVLTADHETGNFSYVDGTVDKLSEIEENLPWDGTAKDISDYIYKNFSVPAGYKTVSTGIDNIENNRFKNDYDNRLYSASRITAKIQDKLGIRAAHDYHSSQLVPIMTIGVNNELFSDCSSIADIPDMICEAAEWKDTLN